MKQNWTFDVGYKFSSPLEEKYVGQDSKCQGLQQNQDKKEYVRFLSQKVVLKQTLVVVHEKVGDAAPHAIYMQTLASGLNNI